MFDEKFEKLGKKASSIVTESMALVAELIKEKIEKEEEEQTVYSKEELIEYLDQFIDDLKELMEEM